MTEQKIDKLFKQPLPSKHESVEVPEGVAKYIQWCKDHYFRSDSIVQITNAKYFESQFRYTGIVNWITINYDMFLIAVATGNFTIKQSTKLFYVHFGFDMYLIKGESKLDDGTNYYWIERWDVIDSNNWEKQAQFTEVDIKFIDRDYWSFAVPVKEDC